VQPPNLIADALPPSNIEAEQAVLGSMLIEQQAVDKALELLRPDAFYNEVHRGIFEAMVAIYDREMPVDLITIEQEMKSRGMLREQADRDYLYKLMDAPTTAVNIAHYAGLVNEVAGARELWQLGLWLAGEALQGRPGLERIGALNGRGDVTIVAQKALAGQKRTVSTNPFARGIRSAADMPDDHTEIDRVWFGLYPGSLTYVCGETGAGKSSFLYNVMVHAARNEWLWHIPFGLRRPLKVLYVDPENSGDFDTGDGLCNRKLIRIGQGKPDRLHFHDGQGVDLCKTYHFSALRDLITKFKYEIVVLDPIINLFGTKDENDNAEAGMQFAQLKLLAKQSNCCIIAVHHTGKDASGIFGRGATARLGAADVGLVIRVRAEREDEDDDYTGGELKPRTEIIRVQMVKNRIEPGKSSLFLRMAGEDRFDRVGFDDWKGFKPSPTETAVEKVSFAKDAIQVYMADDHERSTAQIIDAMKEEGFGIGSVRTALRNLTDIGWLLERKAGRVVFYRQMINDDDETPRETTVIINNQGQEEDPYNPKKND